jgi:hypothetical protein
MQPTQRILFASAVLAAALPAARADAVSDWNVKAGEILVEAKLGTPPAVRAMAIVQTAVLEAVNATGPRASLDAAVAAANRAVLSQLLPAQLASIDAAYQAALDAVADGPARTAGIAAGERAAAAVLKARADDGAAAPESYRPQTMAATYVPTVTPAASQWPQRKPWLMAHAAQFRPAPPPALGSDTWARDYNEIKALGSKNSARRTADQTETARFWEYSLPPIYTGVVRSVAQQPGRDAARNARLYAAATQAMDDALISVFDAKYHYNFWRPVTAIRNGDADGHDGTARDASWAPMIDNPMHPEYPSGHSILAGAVAAVVKADVGSGAMPVLSTTSPTAKGATRRWSQAEDFVREVSDARVYEGVHFRFSVDTGAAMGRRIGELAALRHLQPF